MLFRGFSGLSMGHYFMKVVVKGSFIYSLVPHLPLLSLTL